MNISYSDWENYIRKLSKLSTIAAEKMQKYVDLYGFEDRTALIEYAHALIVKYGSASAELACQMYDAIAELENADVPMAESVYLDDIGDTAKAINGSLLQSAAGLMLSGVVARKVKMAGADTTLKNAIRDKAEFAWIPHGDTCPYCINLAGEGWRIASIEILENGHAKHIHAHCDCQYATRMSKKTKYEGYNPDKYSEIIENAEGETEKEKTNSLRRIQYASNKDMINEQKRNAYAARQSIEEE